MSRTTSGHSLLSHHAGCGCNFVGSPMPQARAGTKQTLCSPAESSMAFSALLPACKQQRGQAAGCAIGALSQRETQAWLLTSSAGKVHAMRLFVSLMYVCARPHNQLAQRVGCVTPDGQRKITKGRQGNAGGSVKLHCPSGLYRQDACTNRILQKFWVWKEVACPEIRCEYVGSGKTGGRRVKESSIGRAQATPSRKGKGGSLELKKPLIGMTC
eukprot:1159248-Pelagomonas_calceolata.AAC.4